MTTGAPGLCCSSPWSLAEARRLSVSSAMTKRTHHACLRICYFAFLSIAFCCGLCFFFLLPFCSFVGVYQSREGGASSDTLSPWCPRPLTHTPVTPLSISGCGMTGKSTSGIRRDLSGPCKGAQGPAFSSFVWASLGWSAWSPLRAEPFGSAELKEHLMSIYHKPGPTSNMQCST